ncbi:uncharacterized protein LOC135697651 [Ochlerotatus camptorhynchus]|uniref:uncharacterized protein LOC135697651 n=1 Tax=Ochlerotatus camptorhynchus TaxID=644619 RepID=UPI0031D196D0
MPKINLQWAIIPLYLVGKLFCLNAFTYSLGTVYHVAYKDDTHSDGDYNDADDDQNAQGKQPEGSDGISEVMVDTDGNAPSLTQTDNICANNHYRGGTIIADGTDNSGNRIISILHNHFRRQNLEAKRRIKISIIGTVHVVALCTAYAVYHVYSVHSKFSDRQRPNLVRVAIDLTSQYAGLCLVIILVSAALVNQRSLMKLINALFEIDDLLMSRLNIAVPNGRWLTIITALFIGFISLKCTIEVLSCLKSSREENVKFPRSFLLLCIIPQLVCLISELQYIAFLLLIKARYKVLNQVLAAEKPSNANEIPKGNCQIVNRLLKTCHEDKAEIEVKGCTTENDNNVRQPGPATIQSMTDKLWGVGKCRLKFAARTNQLRHIYGIYLKLRQTIQMTNRSFGVRNLILILYQFVTVVELSYMACIVGMRQIDGYVDKSGDEDLILTVLYIGCFLLEFFAICFYSHSTVDEVNSTRQNKITLFTNETDDIGSSTPNPSFRLNLLELHFNCLGLFNVDLSLFYGMIGAMTTYLIILIQFGHLDSLQ